MKNDNENNENIVETVTNVIKTFIDALVDNKENVKVEGQIGERMITVTIVTDKSDVGKVVGKKGRIISSLRVLMQSIVANAKKRINIVVLD